MATVDASIPLQVNQPKDPLQSYAQTLQLAQGIQQYQGQQALREAFQNSDTSTPQGQQDLIKRVGSVNPSEAMTLQGQFTKQREAQSTIAKNDASTKKLQMETALAQMGHVDDAGSVLMYKYTDLTQNKGMSPNDAARLVSADIPVVKAHLAQQRLPDGTPMFSQDMLAKIPDQFDPNTFAAKTMDAKHARELLTYQLDVEKQKNTERHQGVEERQGQQRIGIEASNAAEHRRHDAVEEGQGAQRLGIERERLEGDPNTIEGNAQLIASGKMAPPAGAALRNPVMARTMARVKEINPNFDSKTYKTEQAGDIAFTSGKKGDTVRSLNVATDHFDTLRDLAKTLKNGDIRAFNSLANKYATETGNPAPTNFAAAKKIVADEAVKMIIGAGGGVADRDEAAKSLSGDYSERQLNDVLNTYQRLASGQLSGLKKQYKASTGKDDFSQRFLSDRARTLLDKEDQPKTGTVENPFSNAPKVGTVQKGYRYKGGDPSSKDSWEKSE